jgi:hypothetical protein
MSDRQDTTGRKLPRAPQSCAAISDALGDSLAGTATSAKAWLLLEHPVPWGADAPRQSGLDERLADELERRTHELGIWLLLIRRSSRRYTPERLTCFTAWTGRDGPWMQRHLLASAADVLTLDFDALAAGRGPDPAHRWHGRVLAVCTHAKRDPCCARRGRPLAAALAEHDPAATWECSHLGGHRFAGTLVAFPEGLCYGRVDPADGAQLANLHADGRIALDGFRGRVCDPPTVQAADALLRLRERIDGIDELHPATIEHHHYRDTVVRMRDAHGHEHTARVRRVPTRAARPESCGAASVVGQCYELQ